MAEISQCELTCERVPRGIQRPRSAAVVAPGEGRQPEQGGEDHGGAEKERGHALRPHGPAASATASSSSSSFSFYLRRRPRRLLPLPPGRLSHGARPHASPPATIAAGWSRGGDGDGTHARLARVWACGVAAYATQQYSRAVRRARVRTEEVGWWWSGNGGRERGCVRVRARTRGDGLAAAFITQVC